MPRDFDGSSEYLINTTETWFVGGDFPLSMASWFNCDDATALQGLIGVSTTTTARRGHDLMLRGNQSGDPVGALSSTSAGNVWADTSTGYSTGTWQFATGVWASASSRKAYIDGGSVGSDTATRDQSSIVKSGLACIPNNGAEEKFDGKLSWSGAWASDLTANEILAAARGVNLLRIRPLERHAIFPVWGDNSPEINIAASAYQMTLGGTPTKYTTSAPPVAPMRTRRGS